MDVSRRLIRYWAEVWGGGAYKGVHRVVLRFRSNRPVRAYLQDGTSVWVASSYGITEKELNSRGYFKTQREALLHAQMKLKSHTRRLQKWRKENREHLTAVRELLGECK